MAASLVPGELAVIMILTTPGAVSQPCDQNSEAQRAVLCLGAPEFWSLAKKPDISKDFNTRAGSKASYAKPNSRMKSYIILIILSP